MLSYFGGLFALLVASATGSVLDGYTGVPSQTLCCDDANSYHTIDGATIKCFCNDNYVCSPIKNSAGLATGGTCTYCEMAPGTNYVNLDVIDHATDFYYPTRVSFFLFLFYAYEKCLREICGGNSTISSA